MHLFIKDAIRDMRKKEERLPPGALSLLAMDCRFFSFFCFLQNHRPGFKVWTGCNCACTYVVCDMITRVAFAIYVVHVLRVVYVYTCPDS